MGLFNREPQESEGVRRLQAAQERLFHTQNAQLLGATTVDNDYIKSTELLRVTLDDTSVIRDFETDLLGLVWDDKDKVFIQVMEHTQDGTEKPFRKMNRKGVFWAVSQLKFYMNKSRRLTISDHGDIHKIVMNSYVNNLLTIVDKAEEYDLEPSYRDEIVDKMSDEHFFSLNRSLGGKETEMIHRQATVAEITHKNDQQQAAGALARVFGGGR